jgi:hypothetical protein
MMLTRKTKVAFMPMRARATVAADPSKLLSNELAHEAAGEQHRIDGDVVPSLTLFVKGVGEIYLSPDEVKQLVDFAADAKNARFVGRFAEREINYTRTKEVK